MGEITIDSKTFYDFVKTKAREDILKDYVKSGKYLEKEMVELILGINEEKGE